MKFYTFPGTWCNNWFYFWDKNHEAWVISPDRDMKVEKVITDYTYGRIEIKCLTKHQKRVRILSGEEK